MSATGTDLETEYEQLGRNTAQSRRTGIPRSTMDRRLVMGQLAYWSSRLADSAERWSGTGSRSAHARGFRQ